MSQVEALIVAVQVSVGVAAGFIMHRADFCFAGIFRDLFLFRRRTMLHALTLLILAVMLLYALAHWWGLLRYPLPLFGVPSLTNLLGGAVFGVGMVLAGGCVVGSLYRAGAGSTLSGTALLGLIIGSMLYAEADATWKQLAPSLALPVTSVTLPQLAGFPPWLFTLLVAGLTFPLLLRWWQRGELQTTFSPEGHIQPWLAALLLAGCVVVSTVITGMPMGITTSYAKLAGFILSAVAPAHAATLSFFKRTTLHLQHPLFGITLTGGYGPHFDGIALVQFPLMAGLIAGGALSALLLREFQIHLKAPWRQYLSALCGGILMGAASRVAPACNIWHLTGGLPILSLQSILFVAGLLPGSWLGTKLLTGLVVRS